MWWLRYIRWSFILVWHCLHPFPCRFHISCDLVQGPAFILKLALLISLFTFCWVCLYSSSSECCLLSYSCFMESLISFVIQGLLIWFGQNDFSILCDLVVKLMYSSVSIIILKHSPISRCLAEKKRESVVAKVALQLSMQVSSMMDLVTLRFFVFFCLVIYVGVNWIVRWSDDPMLGSLYALYAPPCLSNTSSVLYYLWCWSQHIGIGASV